MAYDDPRRSSETAYRDDPRFGSSGFDEFPRDDYAQGYDSSDYPESDYSPSGYAAEPGTQRPVGVPRSRPKPTVSTKTRRSLDEEKEKDRVSVHLLWEGVLLLFAGALLYLLHGGDPSALRGDEFRGLAIFATIVGFLGVGAGLSVRSAVPNLALGPVAYTAALFFARRSDQGLTTTALITLLVACGLALAISAIAVGFQVPAWAASLGVGIALMAWLQEQDEASVVNGAYQPEDHSLYWFLGFVALSVTAGLIGLVSPIRRTLGGYRTTGDPALRPAAPAVTTAILAIVGSTVLAGIAGILLALSTRPLPAGENGLALSAMALGAAFLGGTSAHGRRGGVFGTVLGVTLLVLLWRCGQARDWDLSLLAIGAAAVLAGLVVTRLVETFGRPQSEEDDELLTPIPEIEPLKDSSPNTPKDSPSSVGSRTGGWSTTLSSSTSEDRWGDEGEWNRR